MKRLTNSNVDLDVLRHEAISQGMISLRENAVKKLLGGETTYQEVLRVTWERYERRQGAGVRDQGAGVM